MSNNTNNEDKRLLSEDELREIYGGRLNDFQIALIIMIVTSYKSQGKTLEETIKKYEERVKIKSEEYYETIECITEFWNLSK